MASTFTGSSLLLDKQSLQEKEQELGKLQQVLSEKELDLSTLKGQLHIFERRYYDIVGVKYAELDEVKALVLELASRFYPRSEEFRESARSARDRAGQHSTETGETDPDAADHFNPSDDLKKLFRDVAKKIHPDLASDPEEKFRRNELMSRLNHAYDRLDEEGIRSVLVDWQAGNPEDGPMTAGAKLVRILRQISQVRKRLDSINHEIETLKNSGLYQLFRKVESAGPQGHLLLEEMAVAVEQKILLIKSRVRDLASELD